MASARRSRWPVRGRRLGHVVPDPQHQGIGGCVNRRARRRRSWWWRYPLAALMIVFALLPVLWVVSASLNPAKTLVGASLIPRNLGFGNYDDLINHPSFPYEKW